MENMTAHSSLFPFPQKGDGSMLVRHAKVFLENGFVPDMDVRVEEGKVIEIGAGLMPRSLERITEATGAWLIPGFVDVHIHACGGYDTMKGEADIRAMARILRSLGVSAFLPTTMSASVPDTEAAVKAIRKVIDRPEAGEAQVLGAHMEAPFLQPEKAGAQVKEYFLMPSMENLEKLTGGDLAAVRILTMAPELPGAEAFVREAAERGIVISAGHTSATAEQIHAAADWGCNHVTHTFNAQTPVHHRKPGVPGAAMVDERLYCEMICDGIHLHPDIIRLIVRCKGADKAVMITDSMEAAAMPDGEYELGGQKVFVKGPEARLADGTLAGSVLTMPQALKNMIHRFGFTAEQAVRMCTATPADSIGEKLAGRIKVGSPVPLTLWDENWEKMTVIED